MNGRRTDHQRSRLTGGRPLGERSPGLRIVGGAASRIAGPIVARHGGGVLARLKAEWQSVAGAELARLTWPEWLGRDGALKLRVVPGYALELQHRAPLVIERINGFFGRVAVARLVLLQGPLPLAAPPLRTAPPPLSGDAAKELDSRLAGVDDPELRAALEGFGRLVLANPRRGD